MNIILLGAPGSGKGTQSRFLEEKIGMVPIATGDLFRENVRNQTEMGKIVDSIMKEGGLVPDEITIKMIVEHLGKVDCKKGFILDGFPRNVKQAEALEKVLAEKNIKITAVIKIEIPEDVLIKRTTGRFMCSKCGESYHEEYRRPVEENVCDKCGAVDQFFHRADDNEVSVKKRIETYYTQTAPLFPFYEDRGILKKVDGTKPMEEVSAKIMTSISQ